MYKYAGLNTQTKEEGINEEDEEEEEEELIEVRQS